eukprot:UN13610
MHGNNGTSVPKDNKLSMEATPQTSTEVSPREKSRKLNLDENVMFFHNMNINMNDDYDIGMRLEEDGHNRSRRASTPGSVSPFNPSTPRFNASYYQRVNENVGGPYSRPISRRESLVSSTDAASHTFLLLSDDDFMSKYDDIYFEVPEESAADSYFSATAQ